MQNEKLFSHLADLLVKAHQKDEQFVKALSSLGAEIDSGILEEIKDNLELPLVLALGGTEKHYDLLSNGELFYYFRSGKISKQELLENIQHAITNNQTENIQTTFIRA